MRPYSSYAGPSTSTASQARQRQGDPYGYPSGSSRSTFPRRRSPERGGPPEYARPRDIPSRSANGPSGRPYPPSTGGRTSRWGPELPYSSSSSSSSSFGGMSSSPTKGGQGWRVMQESGGRRGQEDRGGSRREADEVDWAEVEAKAREKGFAVPGDIVDEFKRQGHFDQLRRQLLTSLLASPQKDEFLASISSLLLSHLQADPNEAVRISAVDPRLQSDELFKIIESQNPPRRGRGEREGASSKTGPEIIAELMKKLVSQAGDEGYEKKTQRPEHDVSGILTSEGVIGKGVKERVETLLREEVREKGKVVARESPAPSAVADEAIKGDLGLKREGDEADQSPDVKAGDDQHGQGSPREETKSEAVPDQEPGEEEGVPMETD